MQIHLPRYLTTNYIVDALNAFSNALEAYGTEEFEFECSAICFIDPFFICIFTEVLRKLQSRGARVNLLNIPLNIQSYLSRMDFFENAAIADPLNQSRNDCSNKLAELQKIDNQRTIDELSYKLSKALIGSLDDYNPESEPNPHTGEQPHDQMQNSINYILSESLQNSLSHGRKKGFDTAYVWTSLQYYPTTQIVNLAIVDNGAGFLRTLCDHPDIKEKTHEEAIRLALLPEKSCNRDQWLKTGDAANLGLGLTVISDLVLAASGSIDIISGDCLLRVDTNGYSPKSISRWQGVGISVNVQRDNLKQTLLRSIIEKYQQNIDDVDINFTN